MSCANSLAQDHGSNVSLTFTNSGDREVADMLEDGHRLARRGQRIRHPAQREMHGVGEHRAARAEDGELVGDVIAHMLGFSAEHQS